MFRRMALISERPSTYYLRFMVTNPCPESFLGSETQVLGSWTLLAMSEFLCRSILSGNLVPSAFVFLSDILRSSELRDERWNCAKVGCRMSFKKKPARASSI